MQILFLLILFFSCSIQASLNVTRSELEEIKRELIDEREKKEEAKKENELIWEALQKKSKVRSFDHGRKNKKKRIAM